MSDNHVGYSFGERVDERTCPVCGAPFDNDVWNKTGVIMNIARYECPNDCDGVVTVGP